MTGPEHDAVRFAAGATLYVAFVIGGVVLPIWLAATISGWWALGFIPWFFFGVLWAVWEP